MLHRVSSEGIPVAEDSVESRDVMASSLLSNWDTIHKFQGPAIVVNRLRLRFLKSFGRGVSNIRAILHPSDFMPKGTISENPGMTSRITLKHHEEHFCSSVMYFVQTKLNRPKFAEGN
jgi:hypothetical protein